VAPRSYVDAAGKLTPHFALAEFDCHDGTKVPRIAYRSLKGLCQHYLEPLRLKFGPVRITSGYRPAAYNASIGGAPRSHHVYDWWPSSPAADITCERGTPAEWKAFLETLDPGGLGAYPVHVHVDARRLRSRW
jgi:uncharacterized protein YcbK (DUF882 family)